MKALALAISLLLLSAAFAQNAKQDAPNAHNKPCVIVKRHAHKFGENMSRVHAHRPFDYAEGDYPSDFKWHSELSDGDVRALQQKGGKIVVLRPDYQLADLEDARTKCNQ